VGIDSAVPTKRARSAPAHPIGPFHELQEGTHRVSATGDEVIGVKETDRADAARSARRDAELNRLAELASGGDRRALDLLLGHIRPMVVQYCRARIGAGMLGSQSSEDVAQDVLLAVVGALKRWRPEKRVMAFVYGIASNKVVDAYRAGGRDRSVPTDVVPEEPDLDHGPEQAALHGGMVAELRELLDQLPEHHREILVLRVALGMSAEETAATVGSTSGAVRVTQHRALAKLRELVERRAA
jgi:RNA polymerase sigma-70 factor, ECF subfamily